MGETAASSFQTSSCLGNSLNLVCTLVTVVKISEHTKKAREYEIPQHVLTIQFDVVLNSNHSMYMNFTHAHEFVRLQTTTEWSGGSLTLWVIEYKLFTLNYIPVLYISNKKKHQLLALIQHACALT